MVWGAAQRAPAKGCPRARSRVGLHAAFGVLLKPSDEDDVNIVLDEAVADGELKESPDPPPAMVEEDR